MAYRPTAIRQSTGNRRVIYRKKRNHLEHDQQVAFVEWLNKNYPGMLPQASGNGAPLNGFQKSWMMAEGGLKGEPDLFIPYPIHGKHGVYIEMKVKSGKIAPEQREVMKSLIERNYAGYFCWSLEEAQEAWKAYINGS